MGPLRKKKALTQYSKHSTQFRVQFAFVAEEKRDGEKDRGNEGKVARKVERDLMGIMDERCGVWICVSILTPTRQ